MINKLTINSLSIIALFCLSQQAFSDNYINKISGSKIKSSESEQLIVQQSEHSFVNKSAIVKSKSTPTKPDKSNVNKSDFDDASYNWVPSEWYSPY